VVLQGNFFTLRRLTSRLNRITIRQGTFLENDLTLSGKTVASLSPINRQSILSNLQPQTGAIPHALFI
jgi:hypothetical protein